VGLPGVDEFASTMPFDGIHQLLEDKGAACCRLSER